jgi:ornithine carbamoyltransferase
MDARSDILRGRDLLSIDDLTLEELRTVLAVSEQFRREGKGAAAGLLADRRPVVAAIFEKPSLRTRVSIEGSLAVLGGHAIFLGGGDVQLGKRESVEDAGRCLDRWVDGIIARVFSHRTLRQLAASATVPVVNALCDLEHPMQALADALTILQWKGRIEGVKIAWVGDGNNVCTSLMLIASRLGAHFWSASPEGFEPDPAMVDRCRAHGQTSGSRILVTNDPLEAADQADVVATDVWASMGQDAEAGKRLIAFLRYQVNDRLMSYAKPDAMILHCLPAYRDKEIASELLDSPQSAVWDEAENRLHTQKAVFALTL